MTSLTPFASGDEDDGLAAIDQPGATLASLVDHLMEAASPVAFQVVFQRRTSWQSDAEIRKKKIRRRRTGHLLPGDRWLLPGGRRSAEQSRRKQLSESVAKRIEYIDAKNPKRSFTANIRAVGVPTGDESRDDLAAQMKALRPVFDPQSTAPITKSKENDSVLAAFVKRRRRRTLRQLSSSCLTERLRRAGARPDRISYSVGRNSNFVLVPSSEQLTVEGTRGTRAEQQSRNPLPWPNPDLVQQFQEGMAIGYALDENGSPQPNPIRIPPNP